MRFDKELAIAKLVHDSKVAFCDDELMFENLLKDGFVGFAQYSESELIKALHDRGFQLTYFWDEETVDV
jgi:hypothetical protein